MVFTHQDIAPRNLILDANKKVWLIDWGCAGVYPRGFEQAVLRAQSENDAFADVVLTKLPDKSDELTRQYEAIGYVLSIGWRG
jgi:thiamine kinase-like enzyme